MQRDAEILEEIVDNLRPLRGERRKIESEIRARLDKMRDSLDFVRAIPTPAETRAAVEGIDRRLAALVTEIEHLPEGAAFEFRKVAALCGFSLEDSFQSLRATLAMLRSRKGFSGHVNRVNAVCARAAYELFEFSKSRPTGTEEGPFRAIAALLLEATGGVCDGDLKRACDEQLRHHRPRYA
jgi:hypothetical protein